MSPSTPATPPTDARGNIVKAPGEEAVVGNRESGETVKLFTVDEITIDLHCIEPYYDHEP